MIKVLISCVEWWDYKLCVHYSQVNEMISCHQLLHTLASIIEPQRRCAIFNPHAKAPHTCSVNIITIIAFYATFSHHSIAVAVDKLTVDTLDNSTRLIRIAAAATTTTKCVVQYEKQKLEYHNHRRRQIATVIESTAHYIRRFCGCWSIRCAATTRNYSRSGSVGNCGPVGRRRQAMRKRFFGQLIASTHIFHNHRQHNRCYSGRGCWRICHCHTLCVRSDLSAIFKCLTRQTQCISLS